MRLSSQSVFLPFYLLCALTSPASLAAVASSSSATDLADLALEDLLNMEVTSAAKRPQAFAQTNTALFVITQDEIRRSGATSIPEILRLAPGVQVSQRSSNDWTVSIRGFHDGNSDKMLVMLDGRTLYTTIHGGVFWDVQDTLIEDIERIEIIRGPGASLWGANAVSGVINITTKSPGSTSGNMLSTVVGKVDEHIVSARHGNASAAYPYRVYAKFFDRSDLQNYQGDSANDGWQMWRTGFKVGVPLEAKATLSLQGDAYSGQINQTTKLPSMSAPYSVPTATLKDVSGGNIIANWSTSLSDNSELSVVGYWDHTDRDDHILFTEKKDLFDLEAKHRFIVGNHEWVWGGGIRYSQDEIAETFVVQFDPASRAEQLYSLFAQDDINLNERRTLRLTLGSRVEHNAYTGVELQPTVRLLWAPNDVVSTWAAISRAVRTPTRLDHEIRLNAVVAPGDPPTVIAYFGDHDVVSDVVIAHELGFRWTPAPALLVDTSLFYNDYTDLRTVDRGMPFAEAEPTPAHNVVPYTIANGLDARLYGGELIVHYQALRNWRLLMGATYLEEELDPITPTSTAIAHPASRSPETQWQLGSRLDLSPNWDWDFDWRYVDHLPDAQIPSYTALNMQFGWRPKPGLEIALGGRNLLDAQHLEFASNGNQIPRNIYTRLRVDF